MTLGNWSSSVILKWVYYCPRWLGLQLILEKKNCLFKCEALLICCYFGIFSRIVLRVKSNEGMKRSIQQTNSVKKPKAKQKKNRKRFDAKKPKKPPTAFFYFLYGHSCLLLSSFKLVIFNFSCDVDVSAHDSWVMSHESYMAHDSWLILMF